MAIQGQGDERIDLILVVKQAMDPWVPLGQYLRNAS